MRTADARVGSKVMAAPKARKPYELGEIVDVDIGIVGGYKRLLLEIQFPSGEKSWRRIGKVRFVTGPRIPHPVRIWLHDSVLGESTPSVADIRQLVSEEDPGNIRYKLVIVSRDTARRLLEKASQIKELPADRLSGQGGANRFEEIYKVRMIYLGKSY